MSEKEIQFGISGEKRVEARIGESELGPEDRALISDIINHPVVQKGIEKYKIFSEYYFGNKSNELIKKEIKRRADEVFGEDDVYQSILRFGEKLGRPAEDADFLIIFARKIRKIMIDELKKAREAGNLNEAIIKSFAEEGERIMREEQHEIGLRKIGKIIVGIDGEHLEILRPHIPRFAENMTEVNKEILRSFKILAKELQVDPNFKNIERLEGMSWLIGEGLIRGNKWHNYSEDEMKKIKEKSPEAYRSAQITGLKMSTRLFKRYLLTGEMPRVGAQWITKEEFINVYGRV